jgi:hypothetical protein
MGNAVEYHMCKHKVKIESRNSEQFDQYECNQIFESSGLLLITRCSTGYQVLPSLALSGCQRKISYGTGRF